MALVYKISGPWIQISSFKTVEPGIELEPLGTRRVTHIKEIMFGISRAAAFVNDCVFIYGKILHVYD